MTITVSTRNNSLCWRSVLTFFGVNEVFENAIRAALCARWRYILFNFYWFLRCRYILFESCATLLPWFFCLWCTDIVLIHCLYQHRSILFINTTYYALKENRALFAISENTLHTTSQPDESSTIPHRVYFLHFFPSPFLCTCKAFALLRWIFCHLPNPPSR